MKRSIWLWQLFGFAVTSFVGTALHYLYELTGEAQWAAPFSGVNESTWEHMKLLFWPMFIFAIAERFFFIDYDNFWCVKLRGALIGLVAIPVIFYTYNGVIGKSPDYINISIFFIAAALAYAYEAKLLKKGTPLCKSPIRSFGILCGIALLFVIFTFFTPEINVFKDPLANTYGI